MRRRRLLQSLLALVGGVRYAPRTLVAQSATSTSPPLTLSDAQLTTLRALADVVLPGTLTDQARAAAVDRFARWHRNYRESADRGHSYGASVLSQASGPAPIVRYATQFSALDAVAQAHGRATFAELAPADRRVVVEAALNEPQRVTALPARPNGANLIADFMGYFFNSGDGYDLAYAAAIGRDNCRGLDGSDQEPRPLGRG